MEFLLGVVFGACLVCAIYHRRNIQLKQLIQAFVEENSEYMEINQLGDPEKQHNIKWARKVLGT
jgi:hypothetical protein